MKLISSLKLGIFVTILVVASGCNDLSLAPTSEFTEENYWTSGEKAEMVLNTAYGSLSNSTYFFFNAGLSDNAFVGRGDPAGVSSISRGNYNPSPPRFDAQWDTHYNGIRTVHNFLANVDRVSGMSEEVKTRMKAEARFIRAWHYFRLTTWFGDVPHFTTEISIEKSQNIDETPHGEIVDFVHSELSAIADQLPPDYTTENKGRITRGAALALNARVYLFDNEWQGVVDNTEQLMSTAFNYDLFPSYRGLFLPENEYNQEIIFSWQYTLIDVTHSEMVDLAPLTAGARVNTMAPTQELVNAYPTINGRPIDDPNANYDENNPYQNRDPRLDATIFRHQSEIQDTDGTTHPVYIEPESAPIEDLARDEYQGQGSNSTSTGYYQRKYYDPTVPQNFQSGLNLITLRYADVLLMHAEAKNELGEMTQQVWNNTIRPIRARAGLNSEALDYPGGGQEALRSLIRRERRVELALEGLRIFDLRRWGTAEDALSGPVHGAPYGEPTDEVGTILTERSFDPNSDYLWPIPQSELDLNDNLDQNPGY